MNRKGNIRITKNNPENGRLPAIAASCYRAFKKIILKKVVMRTTLITLLIFIFSFETFSQDYKKIVDTTNKWNYRDWYMTTNGEGESKTHSLFITNDTIIDNISYKKLMSKIIREIDTSTVFAAGIREDTINQLVYLKAQYDSEKLIYSFDHNVGDTISIDTTSYGDGCYIRFVKSIDTYELNGFSGKKVEICDSVYHLNNPTWPPSEINTDFWYEGIGSFVSIFNLSHIGMSPIFEIELLCYWNQNMLIYQSPEWNVCEYAIITAIENNSIIPDLKIYPNPTLSHFIISTKTEIKEIRLLDIHGKSVFYSTSKDIDISNLTNGIYILKITTESNETINRKIIKTSL